LIFRSHFPSLSISTVGIKLSCVCLWRCTLSLKDISYTASVWTTNRNCEPTKLNERDFTAFNLLYYSTSTLSPHSSAAKFTYLLSRALLIMWPFWLPWCKLRKLFADGRVFFSQPSVVSLLQLLFLFCGWWSCHSCMFFGVKSLVMRYINLLFTYLLTYLLTYFEISYILKCVYTLK